MKIWVCKASGLWREGEIREYSDIKECIDILLGTERFGTFEPAVVVSKADDKGGD